MSTPISSALPYCTVGQFFDRFDWRTVGDILGDADKRIDLGIMAQTGSPANTRLNNLLGEASGMVEAACLKANRYSVADLQGLTQPADVTAGKTSNAAQMLAGIVAGICMWLVWERRPERLANMQLPLRAQMAMNSLDALEKGEAIFGLQEVADAGNPKVNWQSHFDLWTRNPLSVQARRMFGRGPQWNVPGPSGIS